MFSRHRMLATAAAAGAILACTLATGHGTVQGAPARFSVPGPSAPATTGNPLAAGPGTAAGTPPGTRDSDAPVHAPGAVAGALPAKVDGAEPVAAAGASAAATPETGAPVSPAATRTAGLSVGAPAPARTRAEVEAIIQRAGATPPDWWNSVPLNYPPTLDLRWPEAKGPWDPQKNVGQYVWSVINENPPRWREGVKFMHHVLAVNRGNPAVIQKAMVSLGTMYYSLLEDWARAAFWWRKAGLTDDVDLARCYWKLGSREMAAEILAKFPEDDTRHGSVVKLWADMGELAKALAVAEATARAGAPDIAYLAAGDACRLHGRYAEALQYYQKVLDTPTGWRDLKQNKERARASIDAVRLVEGLDLSRVRDGTYSAASRAYAGPLEVAVTVQAGRITAVKVTRHQEKQFYTALTDTPARIVAKQGVRGVDAVSGATITSEAIINATVKALAKGMQ